jgi:hypothetical protein
MPVSPAFRAWIRGVVNHEPGVVNHEPGVVKREPGVVKRERSQADALPANAWERGDRKAAAPARPPVRVTRPGQYQDSPSLCAFS